MSTDLENRLREAFVELPGETPDAAAMTDSAIARARGLRRRRSLLLGGGATAVVAALVAAGIVGSALRAGSASEELRPAAASSTAAATTDGPQPSNAVSATSGAPDTQSLFQSRQLDQVGGYLLPHGNQLPTGLLYQTAPGKLTPTSRVNATTDTMFLSSGLGSNVPGVNHSAPNNFGMLATAWDLAGNHTPSGAEYGDGNPATRTLSVNITRFENSSYAATAIAKADAGSGPIVWFSSKKIPLSWPGVPGANGAHYLYDLGIFGAQEDYLAVQVVDDFIVSADSPDKASTIRAVTDMVANLRSAKLVK